MSIQELIKKSLKKNKAIIGFEENIRALKKGNVKKIILARSPENVYKQVKHLCKVSDIELVEFDGSNLELGAVCRKPYGIMVLGIEK